MTSMSRTARRRASPSSRADFLPQALARAGPNGHMGNMSIQIRTSLAEPETDAAFVPHRPARPAKAEGGRPFGLTGKPVPDAICSTWGYDLRRGRG